MIACLCHRVSDHAISCEVRAGCASFDERQSRLSVATAGGARADCAQEVFERACNASGRRVIEVAQIGAR